MAERAAGGPGGAGRSDVAAGFKVDDSSLVAMRNTIRTLTTAVGALNKELKALTQGADAVDKVAAAVRRLTGTGTGGGSALTAGSGLLVASKGTTGAGGSPLSAGQFTQTTWRPVPVGGGGGEAEAPSGGGGVGFTTKQKLGMGVGVLAAGGSYLARHLSNIEAGNLTFNEIARGQMGNAGRADIRKATFGEHGKSGGLPFYTSTEDLLGGMSVMQPFAGSFGTARWQSAMTSSSEIGKLLPGQGAQGSMQATAGMLAPQTHNALRGLGYGGSIKAGGGQRNLKEVAKSIERRLWGGPAENEAVITEGMQPGAPLALNLQFLPEDTQKYVVQYMLAQVKTKGHADEAIRGKSKSDKAYAKMANVGTDIYSDHTKLTKSLSQTEQETGEEASGTLKASFKGLSASVDNLSGAFSKLGPVMAGAMLVVGPLTAAMSSAIGSVVAYAAMNRMTGGGGGGGPGALLGPLGRRGAGGAAARKAVLKSGAKLGAGGLAAGAVLWAGGKAGEALQRKGGHERDGGKWHVQDAGKGLWAMGKGAATGALAGVALGPAGIIGGALGGAAIGGLKATWDYGHDQEGYSAKSEDDDEMGGSGEGGGRGPQTYQQLEAWQKASGVPYRIASRVRPGARTHASGSLSMHATGHALDIAGPKPGRDTAEMLAINKWWAKSHGKGLKELIYSGPGAINLYNGMPHIYNPVTAADHHDHVHVSGTAESLGVAGGADVAATADAAAPGKSDPKAGTAATGKGGGGSGATSELEALQSLLSGSSGGAGAPAGATPAAAEAPKDGGLGGAAGVAGADASAIWANLMAQGFSKIAAAGIMGNMQSESGLQFDIVQGGKRSMDPASAGSGGYGLVQWTPGRKLIPLLHGAKPSVASEVKALAEQLTGSERKAGDLLRAAKTVKQASDIFELKYERHAGGAQPIRARQAQAFYDRFAGEKKAYDKGSWEIVQDELAQLHKGEMVLPEKAATKVRQLVEPGGSASGGLRSTGSVTVHAPITVMGQMTEAEIDGWIRVIERKLEHSSMLTSISGGPRG